MDDPNPHAGPVLGDPVTGRANGRRRHMMDSRGGSYQRLPNGREKRQGRRTRGAR